MVPAGELTSASLRASDYVDAGELAGAFVVHTYTRAEALADGVLVDASTVAREAGFKVPVAITQAAWSDCVAWSEADSKRQTHQDESGRLWDVLWMAFVAVRRSPSSKGPLLSYQLYRVPCGGKAQEAKLTTLELHIGPGDAGEPVITIGLPGED